MSYKIAVVTEDGKRISSHFGMASLYKIYTVEDGQIISEEEREKPHHQHHPDQGHNHEHDRGNGHADMFAPVEGCQVLLVGGMGSPAYRKAQETGLDIILTGGEIRPALEAYLRGDLQSDMRRVHQH